MLSLGGWTGYKSLLLLMIIHSPWCSSFSHLPSYTISKSSSVSQIVSSLLLVSPQLLLWHGSPPFSWHAYPIWTFSSPWHSTCSPHHTFSSPHLMSCLSISHTPCTSACCSHFSLASPLTLYLLAYLVLRTWCEK